MNSASVKIQRLKKLKLVKDLVKAKIRADLKATEFFFPEKEEEIDILRKHL